MTSQTLRPELFLSLTGRRLAGGILCPPQPMEGKAVFRSGGLLSV